MGFGLAVSHLINFPFALRHGAAFAGIAITEASAMAVGIDFSI
jgi:hypothetical protein